MIVIGYTMMGIGFILFSQIHSVWQYLLFYTLISLGGGIGGWLAVITVVNNWFIRRRSFALATAMSGVHFGGFLVYVLAFGLAMLPNNFGMMVAPIFAGYMFDKTGTYEVPFLSFAALAFLGAFGMLFVRRPKSDSRDLGVSVAR